MEILWTEMENMSRGLVQKQGDALDRWSQYVLPFTARRDGLAFGGKPTLPPVMNAERRQEMAMYKRQASIASARLKLRQRERASLLASASVSSHASTSSEMESALIARGDCEDEVVSGSPGCWWSGRLQRAPPHPSPCTTSVIINESDASDSSGRRRRMIWVAEPTSDESCNDRYDGEATVTEQHDDWICAARLPDEQRAACRSMQSDPFGLVADLEDGGYGDSCETEECDPCSEPSSAEARCAKTAAAAARGVAAYTSVAGASSADGCRGSEECCRGCQCSRSRSLCERAWSGRDVASSLRLSPIYTNRSDDSFDGSEAESGVSDSYCSLPSARVRPPPVANVVSSALAPPRPASPATLAEEQQQYIQPGSADRSSSPPPPLVRRNSYTLEHPSPALLRSRLANPDASSSCGDSSPPAATSARTPETTAAAYETVGEAAASGAESTHPTVDCRAEIGQHRSSGARFASADDESDTDEEPACDAIVKRALVLLKSKHGGRLASASVDLAVTPPVRTADLSKSCATSAVADAGISRQQQGSAHGDALRRQWKAVSAERALAHHERAACLSRIAAIVRGYLTRLLLKTSKAELLRKTIKDCLKLQEDEGKAAVLSNHPADVDFRRRIAEELSTARRRLHSLFFDPSLADERSRLLAQSAAVRRSGTADRSSEKRSQDRVRLYSNRKSGSRTSGTTSRQAKGLVSRVTAMVIERRMSKKSAKQERIGQSGGPTREAASGRRQLSIAATGLLLAQQRED